MVGGDCKNDLLCEAFFFKSVSLLPLSISLRPGLKARVHSLLLCCASSLTVVPRSTLVFMKLPAVMLVSLISVGSDGVAAAVGGGGTRDEPLIPTMVGAGGTAGPDRAVLCASVHASRGSLSVVALGT